MMGIHVSVTASAVALALALGCTPPKPPALPGDTATRISRVRVLSGDGTALPIDVAPLVSDGLAVKQGGVMNRFRLVEDRRRLRAYFQDQGYFDVAVKPPEITDAKGGSAAIEWTVEPGKAARIASVQVVEVAGRPIPDVLDLIEFSAGSPVLLDRYRTLRKQMARRIRRAGYGHARVYTRAFVERRTRVHWYYYVDAGPRTTVGAVSIRGNRRVPTRDIARRLALRSGDPFDAAREQAAHLDLVDTGAFHSVVFKTTADVPPLKFERPDSGGRLRADQIGDDGRVLPRKLDPAIDIEVTVVEAAKVEAGLDVAAEIGRARGDVFADGTLTWRHVLGPQRHVSGRALIGYGWPLSGDDDRLGGVYGLARLAVIRPGFVHRSLDLRVAAEFEDRLLPTASVRRAAAGPELFIRGGVDRFLWLSARGVVSWNRSLGPLDADTRRAFHLGPDDRSARVELQASAIWDRRDSREFPRSGWLGRISAAGSPTEALGGTRYVKALGELRWYRALSSGWSLATRARIGTIALSGDRGTPLDVRWFDGGPFGMRGHARDELSPQAPCSAGCDDELVGGHGTYLATVELRYSTFPRPLSLGAFIDVGVVTRASNPLPVAPSLAVGLGPRFRGWLQPLSLDVTYRVLDDGALQGTVSALGLFFRLGESF